ncbi:hypothetical protein KIPB_009031, partial [Kipferlia bialata]
SPSPGGAASLSLSRASFMLRRPEDSSPMLTQLLRSPQRSISLVRTAPHLSLPSEREGEGEREGDALLDPDALESDDTSEDTGMGDRVGGVAPLASTHMHSDTLGALRQRLTSVSTVQSAPAVSASLVSDMTTRPSRESRPSRAASTSLVSQASLLVGEGEGLATTRGMASKVDLLGTFSGFNLEERRREREARREKERQMELESLQQRERERERERRAGSDLVGVRDYMSVLSPKVSRQRETERLALRLSQSPRALPTSSSGRSSGTSAISMRPRPHSPSPSPSLSPASVLRRRSGSGSGSVGRVHRVESPSMSLRDPRESLSPSGLSGSRSPSTLLSVSQIVTQARREGAPLGIVGDETPTVSKAKGVTWRQREREREAERERERVVEEEREEREQLREEYDMVQASRSPGVVSVLSPSRSTRPSVSLVEHVPKSPVSALRLSMSPSRIRPLPLPRVSFSMSPLLSPPSLGGTDMTDTRIDIDTSLPSPSQRRREREAVANGSSVRLGSSLLALEDTVSAMHSVLDRVRRDCALIGEDTTTHQGGMPRVEIGSTLSPSPSPSPSASPAVVTKGTKETDPELSDDPLDVFDVRDLNGPTHPHTHPLSHAESPLDAVSAGDAPLPESVVDIVGQMNGLIARLRGELK